MKRNNINNFNLSFTKEELIDLIDALNQATCNYQDIVDDSSGKFGKSIKRIFDDRNKRSCLLLGGLNEALREAKLLACAEAENMIPHLCSGK